MSTKTEEIYADKGNDSTKKPLQEPPSIEPDSSHQSNVKAQDSESEPNLEMLCQDAFEKVGIYLKGELQGACEDYKLLEQMNKVSMARYADLKQTASGISSSLQEINDKYSLLKPYLEQIDQIEEQVLQLEQAAYKLDSYSKKLESRYRALERR